MQENKQVCAPTENKWFRVNPQTINRELFEEKRRDKQQEKTRRIILKALYFVEMSPEKYGRQFETLIPRRKWDRAVRVRDLNALANKLGDHNAYWLEQALEWGQRICNGETWEKLCNTDDSTACCRMVFWGKWWAVPAHLIGGSSAKGIKFPATHVSHDNYHFSTWVVDAVPLVVRYVDK